MLDWYLTFVGKVCRKRARLALLSGDRLDTARRMHSGSSLLGT
jgi:hypothetical protein